jgi:hypothetical protein
MTKPKDRVDDDSGVTSEGCVGVMFVGGVGRDCQRGNQYAY